MYMYSNLIAVARSGLWKMSQSNPIKRKKSHCTYMIVYVGRLNRTVCFVKVYAFTFGLFILIVAGCCLRVIIPRLVCVECLRSSAATRTCTSSLCDHEYDSVVLTVMVFV